MSVILDFLVGILLKFVGMVFIVISQMVYRLIGIGGAVTSGGNNYMTGITQQPNSSLALGNDLMRNFFIAFPVMKTVFSFFMLAAHLIIIMIVVNGMVKALFGPLSRTAENPVILAIRGAFASFMVTYSAVIAGFFLFLGSILFVGFSELSSQESIVEAWSKLTTNVNLGAMVGENIATSALSLTSVGPLVLGLLLLFLMVSLFSAYLKLVLEIVERYVTMCFLAIISPLMVACLASASTTQYFFSWIRMMLSQAFLLGFSSLWLNAINKSLITASVGGSIKMGFMGYVLFITAFVILGTKIDRHMSTLGFTVAQGGDFGSGVFQAFSMTRNLARSMGMFGNSEGRGLPKTGGETVNKGILPHIKDVATKPGATPQMSKDVSDFSKKVAKSKPGETVPLVGEQAANIGKAAGVNTDLLKDPDGLTALHNPGGLDGTAFATKNGDAFTVMSSEDAEAKKVEGVPTAEHLISPLATGEAAQAIDGFKDGTTGADIEGLLPNDQRDLVSEGEAKTGIQSFNNMLNPDTIGDGSFVNEGLETLTGAELKEDMLGRNLAAGDKMLLTGEDNSIMGEHTFESTDFDRDTGKLRTYAVGEGGKLKECHIDPESGTHFTVGGEFHSFDELAESGDKIAFGHGVDGDFFYDKDGESHKLAAGALFTDSQGNVMEEVSDINGVRTLNAVESSNGPINQDNLSFDSHKGFIQVLDKDAGQHVESSLDFSNTYMDIDNMNSQRLADKDLLLQLNPDNKEPEDYKNAYKGKLMALEAEQGRDQKNIIYDSAFNTDDHKVARRMKAEGITSKEQEDDYNRYGTILTRAYNSRAVAARRMEDDSFDCIPKERLDSFQGVKTVGFLHSKGNFKPDDTQGFEHNGSILTIPKSSIANGKLKVDESGYVNMYDSYNQEYKKVAFEDIRKAPVGEVNHSVNGVRTNAYGNIDLKNVNGIESHGASREIITNNGSIVVGNSSIIDTGKLGQQHVNVSMGNPVYKPSSVKTAVAVPSIISNSYPVVPSSIPSVSRMATPKYSQQLAKEFSSFGRPLPFKHNEVNYASRDRAGSYVIVGTNMNRYFMIADKEVSKSLDTAKEHLYPAMSSSGHKCFVQEIDARSITDAENIVNKAITSYGKAPLQQVKEAFKKSDKTRGNFRF